MNKPISGGCLCGAVRYVYQGDIDFSILCQCRRCQHITGSGHAASFAAEKARVQLTGKLSYFDTPAESGHTASSGFCPGCGCPILSMTDRFPDRYYIHAGSLDDPSRFKPGLLVFEKDGQPWDHVDPALKDR